MFRRPLTEEENRDACLTASPEDPDTEKRAEE